MNEQFDYGVWTLVEETLSEEVHPEIMKVANENWSKHTKFSMLTKKVRQLSKKGVDHGLESDSPAKGSSRAVFFPKEDHPVKIDGQHTKLPHVLKVSFSGTLDKHLPHDHELLGSMQNNHEIGVSHYYSVLKPIGKDEFETNEDGFLPPLIDHHEDGHWMQVGKISKINSADFKEATKTEKFPKGISHKDFHEAVQHHYYASQPHMGNLYTSTSKEKLEKLGEHPLVNRAVNFCLDTDTHPVDFNGRNMGIWHHPVTGTKHVVAADAGFSITVAKAYNTARKNYSISQRGY